MEGVDAKLITYGSEAWSELASRGGTVENGRQGAKSHTPDEVGGGMTGRNTRKI